MNLFSWMNRRALPLLLLAFTGLSVRAAEERSTNDFAFVDLSTNTLAADHPAARQFSVLPQGLVFYEGIPFKAGLPLAVTGIESARGGEFYPASIRGILIGFAARRLHLLHATTFADRDGTPLARVNFHYSDGGEESVRLGYGIHARAWVTPRLEKRAELLDVNSRQAWTEPDDRGAGGIRLFQTALENPRPGKTISSIDIVSLFSHAAPFMAAITAERAESTRLAARPQPVRKGMRDLGEFGDAVYRGELSVQVLDEQSRAPFSNAVASLSITDDKESFYFGSAVADAQGRVKFPYPPQDAVGVSIWVHAPARIPVVVAESKTNVSRFAGSYTAALRRGTPVGGIVRSAGQPVAGARVMIFQTTRISPHHYNRTDYDMVQTGPDGRWSSESLPTDVSGFNFQVSHPAFRSAIYMTAGGLAGTDSAAPVSSTSSPRRLTGGIVEVLPPRRVTTSRAGALPLLSSNALLSLAAEMNLQPAF
ncbi:MAG: hexosaminidase, partial [Verrucomicrobiota bacterium]